MAKYHLDRLKSRYGWKTAVSENRIRGEKYQDLMNEVLGVNAGNIQRATGRISRANFDAYAKTVRAKGKRFVLPDVSEALPKRSVYFAKAADRGKLITDTLRDRLTKELREVITAGAIRKTGMYAGTVKPSAIQELEQRVAKTFSTYTKKDPRYGMPSNIHTIAVTELRSNVAAMKGEYTKKLLEQNPGMKIMKKWRQNKRDVKSPRRNHGWIARRAPIPYEENFVFPASDGTMISTPYPHHPSMPPGEVIGCNCDVEYSVSMP